MEKLIGRIRIGTSNGHIPGNKISFPPEFRLRSRLHYYSTIFNSIEVNRCFYKTPLFSTFKKWSEEVTDNFQFTLKLSRDISHVKGLQGDLAQIDSFLEAASGVGNKKGCLLIQFPGKVDLEHFNQVEKILEQLKTYDPAHEWRTAIEFRNETWYIGETTELLDQYKATIVVHDFAKAKFSTITGIAGFVYMRFHGPTGNYRGSYSNEALDTKAEEITALLKEGKDVYAYFNNTIGDAYENARYLQEKINELQQIKGERETE